MIILIHCCKLDSQNFQEMKEIDKKKNNSMYDIFQLINNINEQD